MSASICLYKLSDAKFQNKGILSLSRKEFESLTDETMNEMWETKDSDRFEDGKPHDIVDLTYLKWCFGDTRGWKRVRRKFERLPIQSGFVDGTGDIHKYIVVDMLGIYSGLYLNHRYYKKNCWAILCTTRSEVEACFQKYGTKDSGEVVDLIMNQWEDGKTFLLITY